MYKYNDLWTREKFVEYRKLKRNGYSHEELKEHFGDDIYHSGMYSRNPSGTIPFHYLMKSIENTKIDERKTNPEKTFYMVSTKKSKIYPPKVDYILTFLNEGIYYTICLMYFKINKQDTYNVVFTTSEQWSEYNDSYFELKQKGNLSDDDWVLLNNTISKETNLSDILPVFKKLTWTVLDFYGKYLNGNSLSIGDTNNYKKTNFYRNIIEESFPNFKETETIFNDTKFYIYINMSEYNDKWTREKFVEYRKLKRNGYSHQELKEHFGDDIYHSGLYSRNISGIIPYQVYVKTIERMNEIKLNPKAVYYTPSTNNSYLQIGKKNHIMEFMSNNIKYTICLMYFKTHNTDTYNVIFTTSEQWQKYKEEVYKMKGDVSVEEHTFLSNIISKETKLNDLFPVFRKLSWVILDYYNKNLKGECLSIGETINDTRKIKLYRNIIKDSFPNFKETETTINNTKYYLYI